MTGATELLEAAQPGTPGIVRSSEGLGSDDLVARMRGFEIDHKPHGWPAVQMRDISALCAQVETLQRERDDTAKAQTADAVLLYTQYCVNLAVAAERERLARLFDVPCDISGECEEWSRDVAARIRRA